MMYTRDFEESARNMRIPENYDGNTFKLEDVSEGVEECSEMVENKENRSFFGGIPGPDAILSKIGAHISGKFKPGSEEIMIIALIAFLIFTKSADVESIVILVLLLFV